MTWLGQTYFKQAVRLTGQGKAWANQLGWVGGVLLGKYMYSVPKLVKTVYPAYPWRDWRFKVSPRSSVMRLANTFRQGIPEAIDSVRELLEQIARQQFIQRLEDWYTISRQQLGSHLFLIKQIGTLPVVLSRLFPAHQWNHARFQGLSSKMAMHQLAKRMLHVLFPDQSAIL